MQVAASVVTPATKEDYFGGVSSEEVKERRLRGDATREGSPIEDRGADWNDDEEEMMWRGSDEAEKPLDEPDSKLYISVGALLNYIAPDRPELQYSIKEVMRKASNPTHLDMKRLKRIARFLVGQPRRVLTFNFQERPTEIEMFVDSDFAGCPRTRKSTAGGCAMYGAHCLKSWAKTLPILALSSGEAELMAVVKGTTEAMGLQALFSDLGRKTNIAIKSDATAAIGIVSRVGLGKVRHLSVADLWIQQAARQGRAVYSKVPGQINPADMFTKAVDERTLMEHAGRLGQKALRGRAQSAPQRKGAEEALGEKGSADQPLKQVAQNN